MKIIDGINITLTLNVVIMEKYGYSISSLFEIKPKYIQKEEGKNLVTPLNIEKLILWQYILKPQLINWKLKFYLLKHIHVIIQKCKSQNSVLNNIFCKESKYIQFPITQKRWKIVIKREVRQHV